ncbi:hypothetical protein B0J14DRAFT_656423 [Halenospora varia]|nr:hypothetical protein B0J14DRAFT_656423 [Halenospora varia]
MTKHFFHQASAPHAHAEVEQSITHTDLQNLFPPRDASNHVVKLWLASLLIFRGIDNSSLQWVQKVIFIGEDLYKLQQYELETRLGEFGASHRVAQACANDIARYRGSYFLCRLVEAWGPYYWVKIPLCLAVIWFVLFY